jgi:hypothetical protein
MAVDWVSEFSPTPKAAGSAAQLHAPSRASPLPKVASATAKSSSLKSPTAGATAAAAEPAEADTKSIKVSSKYTQADVAKLKRVFDDLDTDKSGTLTIKELSTTFDGLASGSASTMFSIIDSDGSGMQTNGFKPSYLAMFANALYNSFSLSNVYRCSLDQARFPLASCCASCFHLPARPNWSK